MLAAMSVRMLLRALPNTAWYMSLPGKQAISALTPSWLSIKNLAHYKVMKIHMDAYGKSAEATDASFGSTLSSSPSVLPPSPIVMVISGPSGVGKDAVIRRLQEVRPDLHFVVTATSRSMRPGEQHGVDYFFVSKEEFEEWIAKGKLLEHALVYGEYKGIPRQQIEDALQRGSDVILRVDVQGAATMRKLLPGLVTVFLVAESERALVERLVARKTEPEDKMKVRIDTARKEMAELQTFDYVVINKDGQLDETVEHLEAILVAEKAKVSRRVSGSM